MGVFIGLAGTEGTINPVGRAGKLGWIVGSLLGGESVPDTSLGEAMEGVVLLLEIVVSNVTPASEVCLGCDQNVETRKLAEKHMSKMSTIAPIPIQTHGFESGGAVAGARLGCIVGCEMG